MCVSAVALLFLVAGSPEESQQRLDAAREHVQKGRIAEALEVYQELTAAGVAPAATAIGFSRALTAVGRLQAATRRLDAAVEASGNDPELLAHLARAQFEQGRFRLAEKTAARALSGDDQQPLARLVVADVLTETGRLDEANDAYRWFVRFLQSRTT